MSLTFVIPALNEEKHLPKLLNCIVNQETQEKYDVIVVDGKSEDKTVEIANSYKDRLDLCVLTSDKKNVAHQRNLGGQNAKGDLIVFLDSDFLLNEKFVQNVINWFKTHNLEMLIPFADPITTSLFWKVYFAFINNISAFSTFLGKPYANGPGNIVKKDAFLKFGGYNEQVFVFEDQLYFRDAKKHGLKIKSTSKIRMQFSLRRLDKDGFWGYFYFNIYAGLYFFFKGPIYKKFYDYQMGGAEKK